MKIQLSAVLTIVALTGLAGCEAPPYQGDVRVQDRDYDGRLVFSDHDRTIIRDYYRAYYRSLPPGLAKKGKIPPGHAARLRRHRGVPPGVTWNYLPADVERRLDPLPDGYARVVIGTDIALLHTRTRIVLDVIEDIDD